MSGSARESLKTLVAAWYGARGKSRDTFHGQLLDPYMSDETVDQLRRAAKAIVEGRTHEQLGTAGEALALAAFKIGLMLQTTLQAYGYLRRKDEPKSEAQGTA